MFGDGLREAAKKAASGSVEVTSGSDFERGMLVVLDGGNLLL